MKHNVAGNVVEHINTEWLPHLHAEVVSEVTGNYLDAYVVALEGWRRGLTLRWHIKDSEKFSEMKTWYVDQPGQLFSLHSKDRAHYFFRTRGDKVTNEAVELGMDKEKTKQLLQEANIPVPTGRDFSLQMSEDDIINFAIELGFPVVVKPTDGSFGRGVITNITSEGELRHALDYLRNELNEKNIIVERYINGNDYRLYVVDNEVVGAILRIPPNVEGDGINSIEALIDIKNKERELNPRLVSCPIRINQELVDFIRRSGYTLKSVPEKGDTVFLNDKSNISIGGDPIDVLDELSEEMKNLAVQALRTIPGLTHGAVDLMIEKDDTGTEKGYIIELNPTAQIGGILFPYKGKPRDIPKAIIDYYFPETKGVEIVHQMYFNMDEALLPLTKHAATKVQLAKLSITDFTSVKIEVECEDKVENKLSLLKNEALKRGLFGSVYCDSQYKLTIILAGSILSIENYKKTVLQTIQKSTSEESKWKNTVKAGFEWKHGRQSIINEIEHLYKQRANLKRMLQKVEKEHRKMLQSTSWKVTLPIRKLTQLLKS